MQDSSIPNVSPLAPRPAKFAVGQRVFCVREKRFGEIKHGPSHRMSDMGKDPMPAPGYFVHFATGEIGTEMEPDLEPVFTPPEQLVPRQPVAVSRWDHLEVWATKHQVSVGLLIGTLSLAVAFAALFMSK